MINDISDTIDTAITANELHSAKLLLALTLRQSHGIVFAGSFFEEFSTEIERAMSRASSGMLSSAGQTQNLAHPQGPPTDKRAGE